MSTMVSCTVLLLALILLQFAIHHGAMSGSPVCAENLPLGDEISLSLDCHSSLSPLLEYAAKDGTAFIENLGKFSVDYNCSSSAESEMTEDIKVLEPYTVDPSNTISVTRALAEGATCTFYGCYSTRDSNRHSASFALQPTSCVIDIDECILGNHRCGAHTQCVNTIGGYECYCSVGYTGNGTHCSNIDECAESAPCSENADCFDTEGSFSCQCRPGFSGDGLNCTHIDECAESDPCGDNATCFDTDGGFFCQCKPGFSGDGFNCTPVTSRGGCDGICSRNATCIEVGGSYQCVCDPGFVERGNGCLDINECDEGTHNCSENADCADTRGSYSCTCNPGYEGDGFTCARIAAGFRTTWILAVVGSGIVVVTMATILIIAICIAKKPGRKSQLYAVNMLFGQGLWDEVNLDFNPVQPDSKFSVYSSLTSVFDKLEKADPKEKYFDNNSLMNVLETPSICTELLSEEGCRKDENSNLCDSPEMATQMNEKATQDHDYVTECETIQHSKLQRFDSGVPQSPVSLRSSDSTIILGSEHLINETGHTNDSGAYITTADCVQMTLFSDQDESKDFKVLPIFAPCAEDHNSNSHVTSAALYHMETSNFVCTSTADTDSGGYI